MRQRAANTDHKHRADRQDDPFQEAIARTLVAHGPLAPAARLGTIGLVEEGRDGRLRGGDAGTRHWKRVDRVDDVRSSEAAVAAMGVLARMVTRRLLLDHWVGSVGS